MTSVNLPSLDPFSDIDPLAKGSTSHPTQASHGPLVHKLGQLYVADQGEDDSGDDEYDDGNVFAHMFEDEGDAEGH